MAKINYRKIRESIASSPSVAKRVNTIMEDKFQEALLFVPRDIEGHEVSKEIRGGITATNTSHTLPGGYGNLTSFIGFPAGSDPVGDFKEALTGALFLVTAKSGRPTGNGVRFEFTLKTNLSAIKSATPLPWEGGKSWVEGIEKGISGFGSYLAGTKFYGSRSLGGIQASDGKEGVRQIRAGAFIPTTYLSDILTAFATRAGKRYGTVSNLIQYNR